MRIVEDESPKEESVNILSILEEFQDEYRNVSACKLKGKYYVFRALGRKEYRDLLSDKRINDLEKEEVLCEICLLYPDPNTIDWNKLPAGVPPELTKKILKFSYLDSLEHRKDLMTYYRAEMYDLDNQITCIINEAFPQIDIETIEAWDIEKTTKYLSRAEWKLTNFRGLQFKDPEGEYYEPQKEQAVKTEKIAGNDDNSRSQKKQENKTTIRGGSKRDKLTPEKLEQRNTKVGQKAGAMSLEELKKKFPEVNWGADMGKMGLNGLAAGQTLDTTPPALRTPGMMRKAPPTGW